MAHDTEDDILVRVLERFELVEEHLERIDHRLESLITQIDLLHSAYGAHSRRLATMSQVCNGRCDVLQKALTRLSGG